MKRLISLVFAGLIASTAIAQGADTPMEDPLFLPADMADLSAFQWKKRPVLVFANSENDPAYVAQMEYLRDREEELRLRDVIVLTDTDPTARSALRLRMRPRGFMLVLVDKEGQIELRKPFPWDVREITRSIDKMPLRQREIREAKERDVIR
ncbi:hypothetical protein A3753_16915 [Sulfitobacter sp. HI0082]|jgi:hypothetical protein|uniref:DUF4174 domain-containing protein n=1 Tax=unclassified Sulfitobacter TaxID=196795 RepID=UPI0007C3CBEE|nr:MULTISPECIES: DUF4174 domain-containing protein [unclassified Sulfitobacter]KZZ24543.1 hypothetical protein A3753_16915 [Sulfitobacter sp. HI0082]KZX91220.1 hypothetical protein A3720_08860 [Sulfitobacter sp. HI0021]KZY02497.1 hypothetical protein A3722_00345 [Sulfitobacter sp. HI0027]KZZ02571.1 hypothetical protein A3747_15220 [Sulfitobacter sp. HI0076]HAC49244.1 DUF4174 domain-containing protein [Sulfitobacter sp.]|tara:strand:- start:127 stop:582 length:456 start_codon:yes stop_codon:yes gene_type:complete